MARPKIEPEYHQVYQFHTLKDALSFARSEGFTDKELHGIRRHLKKERLEYPRNISYWRALSLKFSKKNWSKKIDDPKWYSTRVFQIRRERGNWLARVVDTKGDAWMWVRTEFTGNRWKNPIIIPDSRKPKEPKTFEKILEPDFLEIV